MYIYLFVTLLLAPLITPLPDGAPAHVCDSMTPFHSGNTAQVSASPFGVFPKVTQLAENQPLKISLGSRQGLTYQGFMLQGRTSLAHDPIGTFVKIPQGVKTLGCKVQNDTVTHANTAAKGMLEFEWMPPRGYRGDVIFNATVAQNYGTFWIGVESPVIHIVRASEVKFDAPNSFYAGCFDTHYCFGAPIGCEVTENCKVAVKIGLENGVYMFEMKGPKEAAYVAVGLSDDLYMGNDSVMECVKNQQNKVDAFMSRTLDSKSKGAVRLDNPKEGIQLLSSNTNNGEIYCKLSRQTKTSIVGVTYDLSHQKYHVLIAAGGSATAEKVGYHTIAYLAAPEKRSLTDTSPVKTTTPPNFVPVTEEQVTTEDDPFYNGCFTEKGCFGAPDGCVRSKNCKVAVATTVKGERYEFEIMAPRSANYVAVGLSDDVMMGDDSVIECVNVENRVQAYMSVTTPRPNLGVQRLGKPKDGIQLINGRVADGSIYCKVQRDARTQVNDRTYDLTKDKYFLLVAAGPDASANGVGFHKTAYLAAGEARFLADVSEIAGASKLLLRLHGAFMLAAWVGTASFGILLARYYRQTWVGSQICGKDLWFAWHRFFMVCTWTLTTVAFILIFVELKAWSTERNPHAILGTITTIICFLQPIGAFFRPHPGTSKRPIFNWLHWLGGNVAHILAIVTIFFAVKLNKAELPDWFDWILVAYVAFHVSIHLILSILGCISDRASESRVTSFPMKDLGANGRTSLAFERNSDAPKSALRRIILFLYLLVIICFVVAMIFIIVVAPVGSFVDKVKKRMSET